MSRFFRRLAWVAGILILLALVSGTLLPSGHGSKESHYTSRTFAYMQDIAKAIADYAAAHDDKMPQKMSDLYSQSNAELLRMLLFYSPDSNPVDNQDLTAHRELIDMFTAYGFLRLPDHRIVVFERPGFRKGYMNYIIQGNDGRSFGYLSSCSASLKEFMNLFSLGFPDHPYKEDYQNIDDYEIGRYEYELEVRGKWMQSFNSAFLAGAKPPITSDAARAKVQAAMDKLDPPGTWMVEKGVKASDGCTPYYFFWCIYVKDPENANPVGTYVLFDGTVLVPSKHGRPAGA